MRSDRDKAWPNHKCLSGSQGFQEMHTGLVQSSQLPARSGFLECVHELRARRNEWTESYEDKPDRKAFKDYQEMFFL